MVPRNPNPNLFRDCEVAGDYEAPGVNCRFLVGNPVIPANSPIFLTDSSRSKSHKSQGYENRGENCRFRGHNPAISSSSGNFPRYFLRIQIPPALGLRNRLGLRKPTTKCRFRGAHSCNPTKFLSRSQGFLRDSSRSKSHKSWDYEVAWGYKNPVQNWRFRGA